MALKARKPEEIEVGKPKMLLSAAYNMGKTFWALDFPKPYLIDVENSATRPQYVRKLKEVGGAYFGIEEGSQNFETVLEEIKELATTKHPYQTLILDTYSWLYLLTAAEAEEEGGSEYGRDKKEANKPSRQLLRLINKIDMTILLICHNKDKWEGKGQNRTITGTTFDGYEKLEAILDLWIEIVKDNYTTNNTGEFLVKKSRIDTMPRGQRFPLNYNKFAELYGKSIIEKPPVPLVFANHAQLVQMQGLIDALNITKEQQDKVLKTFDADKWEECTEEQIQKAIGSLQKKIKEITGEKK